MTQGTAVAPSVLLAVLGGALLHASWNALLKRRGEPLPAAVLVVAVVLLPFLPAPARASWGYIAASSAVQTIYYLLLIATYRDGDISHAYPLMRGCAPLIVALASGPLTGDRLSPGQWTGMLLICGGVLGQWLATPIAGARRTTGFALLTAGVIATAIAAFVLRERIGPARIAAVVMIACGAVAMRLA